MASPLRVLVVEDHEDLRRSLTIGLELEGFRVQGIGSGSALPDALAEPLDAVLLDRDLPDAEGLTLIPLIRAAQPSTHIIVLSGTAAEDDRVTGLLAGADDYVPKPASVREISARLTAVGRQRQRAHTNVLTIGPLTIDPARRRVLRDGAPLAMTRRELDVLHYLARNAPRTIGRDELLAAVWGSSSEWQTPATVTEHVRRIRLKIEDDPSTPRWITSVRGVGYQFNVDAGGPARETAAAATVVVDGDHIVHATAEAARLIGAHDVSALVGRSAMEFIAPHSIAATSARRATWAAGSWPRPEIITLVRVDGAEVHVEITSTPIVWRDRPASQVTLWPIEGRTGRLRQLATGIATDVADAVIMFDPAGRIESFNGAAERLYGWREQEVIGRPVTDVLPWVGLPSDRERAWADLDRVGMWHGTVLQRRRDGHPITVTSSATRLRDDAGLGVGTICVNRMAQIAPPRRGADADTSLLDDLARAVGRDELVVDYQRIVRLDDTTTTGFEALVRWHHPTRGVLAPDAFIDLAERAGLIVEIGDHVLRAACRQLRAWRTAGLDVHVAVNVSAGQLADPRLVATVEREMADNDLPAGALWLEVTETSLVEDTAAAARALAALRAHGARIAIDDFGTGWASLTYLHHFPVDALKIDQIFVDGLESRPSDTAIARSIVALAQELDIGVVAEGIETGAQLAALQALGCTLGQGYLFGRPGPPEPVAR